MYIVLVVLPKKKIINRNQITREICRDFIHSQWHQALQCDTSLSLKQLAHQLHQCLYSQYKQGQIPHIHMSQLVCRPVTGGAAVHVCVFSTH